MVALYQGNLQGSEIVPPAFEPIQFGVGAAVKKIAHHDQFLGAEVVQETDQTLQVFAEMVGALTKTREDIKGWLDLLDLDDYVSFGGKE